MQSRKIQIIFFLMTIVILSCGVRGQLGGGPEDKTPPKLISHKSTPDRITNFNSDKIEFVFDEYIELKNAFKEITFSPPLEYIAKKEARGKKLTISFHEDEQFKKNVTYLVDFGNSIFDYSAGNPLENFQFIFSTGEEIDSLSISGKIIPSKGIESVEDVLVLLYDTPDDSLPYNEQPSYFSRTDQNGEFSINNLRSDTYQFFALKDENVNFLYDLESEKIGFLDSLIELKNSSITGIETHIFKEDSEIKLIDKNDKHYGKLSLEFSKYPEKIELSTDKELNVFHFEQEVHIVNAWFDVKKDSSFNLIISLEGEVWDTIAIKKRNKKELDDLELKNKKELKSLSPFENAFLEFNHPIKSIEKDSIIFQDTSGLELDFELKLDSIDPRRIIMNASWEHEKPYTMTIPDSCLVDIYGSVNDSITLDLMMNTETNYSDIVVKNIAIDSTENYVLILKKSDKIISEFVMNSSQDSFLIKNIEPESYTLEIIQDINKNGKWDSGNYLEKRKPEKTLIQEIEKLEKNTRLEIGLGNIIFDN